MSVSTTIINLYSAISREVSIALSIVVVQSYIEFRLLQATTEDGTFFWSLPPSADERCYWQSLLSIRSTNSNWHAHWAHASPKAVAHYYTMVIGLYKVLINSFRPPKKLALSILRCIFVYRLPVLCRGSEIKLRRTNEKLPVWFRLQTSSAVALAPRCPCTAHVMSIHQRAFLHQFASSERRITYRDAWWLSRRQGK